MFEDILGNKSIHDFLENNIFTKQISHSYLFSGDSGILKRDTAKRFAKLLLCSKDKTIECKCKSCIDFESDNNLDFYQINPEKDVIKIDRIRNLQSKIYEKPITSERKIYIINESEKMTIEAQNCLLKTLEEPPEFVTFILITSKIKVLINTIKSRCIILNFNILSKDQLEFILNEKYKIKLKEDVLINSYGSIDKAIKLNENIEKYDIILKNIENVNTVNIIDFINGFKFLYDEKDFLYDNIEYLNIVLFSKFKSSNDFKYLNVIEKIESVKRNIERNSNFKMSVDDILFEIHKNLNE